MPGSRSKICRKRSVRATSRTAIYITALTDELHSREQAPQGSEDAPTACAWSAAHESVTPVAVRHNSILERWLGGTFDGKNLIVPVRHISTVEGVPHIALAEHGPVFKAQFARTIVSKEQYVALRRTVLGLSLIHI